MAFPVDILKLSELIADSITGALIKTAEAGARWIIQNGAGSGQIIGYTGDPLETQQAQFRISSQLYAGAQALIASLAGPSYTLSSAYLSLYMKQADTTTNYADLVGTHVEVRTDLDATTAQRARLVWDKAAGKITCDSTNGFEVDGATKLNGATEVDGLLSVLGGEKIGSVGSTINALTFARTTGTCNASSQLIIPHGLGVVPAAVLLGGASCMVRVQGWDATNITLLCFTPAGVLVGAVSETVSWFCLA